MATAQTKKKDEVLVPRPKIAAITFEIEGSLPGYLGNAWSDDAKQHLPPYPKRTEKKDPVEPDFTEIASKTRRMLSPQRDGATDGFPAISLKQSIVNSGMRLTDMVGTELRAQFAVVGGPDGLIPIRGTEWKEFTRTGNLGGKKGSGCLITQPLYPAPWYATVRIEYDVTNISEEAILALVMRAGMSMGIGAWRPEKSGEFGRFRINEDVKMSRENL